MTCEMVGNQPNSLQKSELSKLRILLVEDNLVNQKVTLKQLNRLGYAADVAANGQEAVEAVARTKYDIVLMDCQMPVLDGYAATRAIRAMTSSVEQCDHPIVIAITANALSQDRDRAIACGMNDYLKKPVTREMLAKTLAHWGQILLEASLASTSPGTAASQMGELNLDRLSTQIDWEHLHHISDGSVEFELELLQLFTQDSYSQLKLLKEAIAILDFRAIEEASHHIKGASANVGAIRMQAAAAELEQQARQKQLDAPDQLLIELERSLNQIQTAIQR